MIAKSVIYFLNRRILLLWAFVLVPHIAFCQSVADLWIAMPDEMVPFLTLNQKKEMIECYNIGVDSKVKNKFEGFTGIDTLMVDYGSFYVSDSRNLQLVKLPTGNDSILLLIDTYKGPVAHSQVSFYSMGWERLSIVDKMPSFLLKEFVARPDTMEVKEYEEMLSSISPVFIEYKYDVEANSLLVQPYFPLAASDEKERLFGVVSQKKLIWNGKIFNECYKIE